MRIYVVEYLGGQAEHTQVDRGGFESQRITRSFGMLIYGENAILPVVECHPKFDLFLAQVDQNIPLDPACLLGP